MLWVFTLNFNGKNKLDKLYKSVNFFHEIHALSEYFPEFKWLIKDNGSSDGSFELIDSWKNENIICYKYPNNIQNFSQGNNWLFERASPKDDDYILLLNNDIVFNDYGRSLNKMQKLLYDDNTIGVVGSKLNYADRPNLLQHAGVLFHPKNIGTPFNYRSGQIEKEIDKRNRLFPITTGALLLTRASLYKEIGGLNEKLQWCWDDCWYCLEVGEKNKKIVVCGETDILHEESATLKKNPQQKLFFQQNTKLFMDKWADKIDKTLVEKYDNNANYAIYN